VIGLGLAALPSWLYRDWFAYPSLRGDDFAFLADCRSGADPYRALWAPHNTHVVPLFRLMTAALCRASGPLGNLPATLSMASHALLVVCAMAAGHLVAWETGRLVLGLAAIAGLGLSTVLQPAATWYSAAQTLLTGLLVLTTLVAAQAALLTNRRRWLLLAALASLAAPLTWTAGLSAGPVAAIYLRAHRDRPLRRLAWVPLIGTVASVALAAALAGPGLLREVSSASSSAPPGPSWPLRPITHTAQAIVESLVLGNLGVPTPTEPIQAVVLVGGLLALWAWARRGSRNWPGPLESAGLALVGFTYLMAFALRSGYDYANLRDLGWYNTLPQLGAVLFGFGWIAGPTPGPRRPAAPSPVEFLALAAFVTLGAMLHQPRAEAIRIADAPPMLPSEVRQFLIPELQHGRAIVYAEQRAERQRRALLRLERAASQARAAGVDRGAVRAAIGPIRVPGWPLHVTEIDALDLVDFPDAGRAVSPAAVVATFGPLLAPEPYPRLPWSDAGDPWPPTDWPTVP
jgi:hypothetical protein